MKGWKEYTINDIAEVTSSKRIFLSDYVSDGVPFYRSKEVIEKSNGNDISLELFIEREQFENIKKKFGAPEENDILLTSVGTIGVPYKVKKDETFYFKDGNLTWIRKYKGDVDPNFLLQWIKSELGQQTILQNTIGSSQPALTIAAIKKIKLSLPSLPTQQRIASILSAYDDLIEVNNQRIKLLEETARELYKEWFIRMRFPGYKKAKFVKGIPETWTIESLKDHITIVRGKSYTSEEIDDNSGDRAFINLKNMKRNGGFRLDGTKFFSGKFKNEQVVMPGDIVMAVTDMTQDRLIIGRVARVPLTEHKEYVISLDIVKIVSTKLSNDFIYSTLRFNYYGEHIAQFANGTNVLHLNPELLRKESVLIPDEDLIKSFVQTVKPMFELIDVLAIESEQLRQIRDRLLPRLISGKLEVK